MLEQQLGIELFVRGPRSLILADAGASYLEHINALFLRPESVTEQLQIRFGRAIERLRIPPFFASELLLPRLRLFLEARPETDVHIDSLYTPLISHPAEADLSISVGSGLSDHATSGPRRDHSSLLSPNAYARTP